MEKYVGKDDDLIKMLTEKYGPEPPYVTSEDRERNETDARRRELSAAADAVRGSSASANKSVSFATSVGDVDDKKNNNSSSSFKTRLMRCYQHYEPSKATDDQ